MKNLQKDYWESIYNNDELKFPLYDGWLDKYFVILRNATSIIDLGCGNGVDTIYLSSNNINTIACDFSEKALKILKELLPTANTMCFDMTNPFPFKDQSVEVVLSDLSLHYFDTNTTKKIINEISRILTVNGSLLCRVNSICEINKSEIDAVIEDNYYLIDGSTKRFFDKNSIMNFFENWDIKYIDESATEKYRVKKFTWEIHAIKK